MNSRNIIATILCLLISGCASQVRVPDYESQARNQMIRAVQLENSSEYHQAAQAYAAVAEQYPFSSCYKTAVWKAALLNIHPDNSENQYSAALHWLNVYLELPISSEEKDLANLYISMLERNNRLQTNPSAVIAEKERLLAVTREQSVHITNSTQQLKKLEAELAQARDELDKMKAVDVRMHRSRVNRNGGQSLAPVQKVLELNPEADSSDTEDSGHAEGIPEDSMTGQKEVTDLPKQEEKIKPLISQDVLQKSRAIYPYTIQISSCADREASIRKAMRLRKKGDSGFVSHVHIPGNGDWYRVFVGFYGTFEEAKKAVFELKNQGFPQAFVVKMPFAVQVESFFKKKAQRELEANLRSKGFLTYRVPGKQSNDKTLLLIGAFRTKKEAATLANILKKEGLMSIVVQR